VIRALRAAGHDVLAIAESATGASYEAVIARALSEGRVLIAEDSRFRRAGLRARAFGGGCDVRQVHEPRARRKAGGSGDQHAAGDQVIEQLTDRSQVLFDARLNNFGTELRDICRDSDRLDVLQLKMMVIAPIEEAFYRGARTPSGYCGCGSSQ
jgi:hypothetical protein